MKKLFSQVIAVFLAAVSLCANAYAVVVPPGEGINWISGATGEPLFQEEETVTPDEVRAKKTEVETRYGIKITDLAQDRRSLTNQLGCITLLEEAIKAIPVPLYEAVRDRLSAQGKTLTVQFDWDVNTPENGSYDSKNVVICLQVIDKFTFAHEYGHLLQMSVLSGSADLKNQWMEMNYGEVYGDWSAGTSFVSDYAATSYAEDFAETFGVLLADSQTAQTLTANQPESGAVEKLLFLRQFLSDTFSIDVSVFPDIYPSKSSAWAEAGIAEYVVLFPSGCLASASDPFYPGYQSGVTRQDFALGAYELVKTIWREQYDVPSAFDPWSEVYPDVKYYELHPFSDLTTCESGVEEAVVKLYTMGVVNGKGDSIFDPNGLITRQEAAKMLYQLCVAMGYTFPNSPAPTFNDANLCADWAIDSINAICSAKIMSGVGNGMFNPKATYSYEQSALTMVRVYHLLHNGAV